MKPELLTKISNKEAVVGVIGLGYVGLPLLIEFSHAGFHTLGFDIDDSKVRKLKENKSYIKHIPSEKIKKMSDTGRFGVSSDFSYISDCDAILICVPTPLTEHRTPNMNYIKNTANLIAPYVKEGQIFTLESTTYPGTTEELLRPILEGEKFTAGTDFYLAYSPEREDPNNKHYSTSTIPKVVGGYDEDSKIIAKELYESVICEVIPVSSPATAEATKLMENIFRCVNIALVNELKVIFEKMGVNIWEVINAAKTKPFGYMPFYPGPGLGGHCIPIDPFYLTWKAREYDTSTRFIELAGEINADMPKHVAVKTLEALNDHKKTMNGSNILLIGLSYKKNIDDIRESPSFKIWNFLEEKGAKVSYYDPYCSKIPQNRNYPKHAGIESVKNLNNLASYDAVLISTDHDCIDYEYVIQKANLVIDTRNSVRDSDNVVRA